MNIENIHIVKVAPKTTAAPYLITIDDGLLSGLAANIAEISTKAKVFLVTDRNVARHHLKSALAPLERAGIETIVEILPPGERAKTLATYSRLIRGMAAAADEKDLVAVALGGGVVGDLAGFAASTFKRGIPLIQAPTTLLAAVDSSVGGKTGADLPEGKNLVGSFYQPRAVVIDTSTLKTLPARQMRAGAAEVLKYGFILDAKFADWASANIGRLIALDPEASSHAVRRSCELKAAVVREDERDTTGARAILNFGHTFAHAFETALGYKMLHGEAVAAGMACAAELSYMLGLIGPDAVARISHDLASAGLPVNAPAADPDAIMAHMKKDKKTKGGKSRFVLLDRVGHAFLHSDVPIDAVRSVIMNRIN